MRTAILATEAGEGPRMATVLRHAGFQLLDEAMSLAAAADAVERGQPEVAVIHVPESTGAVLQHLRRIVVAQHPRLSIVLATPWALSDVRLVGAGASAYIVDDGSSISAFGVIDSTLPPVRPPVVQDSALTPREQEILELLRVGPSTKAIAAVLGMSTRTVDYHRANIMHKLQLRTAAELVAFASRRGA